MCVLVYILGWHPALVGCIFGSEGFHNSFHMVLGVLYRKGFRKIPGMVHYLAGEDMCYWDVRVHVRH